MTMSQPEMERVVRRVDNDVTEVYAMLSHIDGTLQRHTRRFGELGAQLEMVEAKVEALDGRLGGVDGQLAEILEILRRPGR